jgi:hypothetical protein
MPSYLSSYTTVSRVSDFRSCLRRACANCAGALYSALPLHCGLCRGPTACIRKQRHGVMTAAVSFCAVFCYTRHLPLASISCHECHLLLSFDPLTQSNAERQLIVQIDRQTGAAMIALRSHITNLTSWCELQFLRIRMK